MPIKDGLLELLSLLDRLKIKKAIATSTHNNYAKMYLEKANVLDFFDTIVTGEMVTRSKPYPDIYLYAAELLKAKPSECMVLEDSIYGIQAAFAAGMKPVMIPDLVLPDQQIEAMLFRKCYSLFDVMHLLQAEVIAN